MSEKNGNETENADKDDTDFRKLGEEGMSILTAQGAISRKLRRELTENYDILELMNQGRYFKARACSKDGRRLYELLIDKQTNDIRVVSQSRLR